MEETWLWYLSGAIDTKARISVHVQKKERQKLGYYFTPRLVFRVSHPENQETLLGMLDEYSQEHNVKYRLQDVPTSDTEKFIIENSESVKRFLEPIMGGFVQQRERAEIMVDEIVPMFEDGPLETQDEAIEVMKMADRLRELPIEGKQSSKYTTEYFANEWGMKL